VAVPHGRHVSSNALRWQITKLREVEVARPRPRRETSSGSRANGWVRPRSSSRSVLRREQRPESAASPAGRRLSGRLPTSGVKSRRNSRTSSRRRRGRMASRHPRPSRRQARPRRPTPRLTPTRTLLYARAPKSPRTVPLCSQHRDNARRRGRSDGKHRSRGTGEHAWSPLQFWSSAQSSGHSCSPREAEDPRRESAHRRAAPTRSEGRSREPSRLPRQRSPAPGPTSPARRGKLRRSARAQPIKRGPPYPRPRQCPRAHPLPPRTGPRKPSAGDRRHRQRNRPRRLNRTTALRPRQRSQPSRQRRLSQRSRPRPQINPRTRARSADSLAVVRRHV
jgi:hypothetical protein